MIELNIFLANSHKNYLDIKNSNLSIEFKNDILIDYFRCLLIKRGSFNQQIFKNWCDNNNNQDLYEVALNDISFLENKNFLKKDGELYIFNSENAKHKLLNFQKKHINKNLYKIDIEKKINDNSLSNEIINIISKKRFNDEVLINKNEIKNFLNFSSQAPIIPIDSLAPLYIQLKDKNINISMLKSDLFWSNIKDFDIKILQDEKINILEPVFDKNNSISYFKFESFFDISQTKIFIEDLEIKESSINEIVKKIENSLLNSNIDKSLIHEFYDYKTDNSIEKIDYLANSLSKHYFFDSDQQIFFKYLFKKSLLIDGKLENFELENIRYKLSNVISTFNLISKELLINDIVQFSNLGDYFYYKLGERDSERVNREVLDLNNIDEKNYLLGQMKNDNSFDYDSLEIAKDIVNNENLKVSVIYQNLFLYSKEVEILSGDLKGNRFIVDGDYTDEEAKEHIIENGLKDIIELSLKENKIFNLKKGSKKDGKNSDKELYRGEYKNDNGRLYEEVSIKTVHKDDERSNTTSIPNNEEQESNGRNAEPSGNRVQGNGSLGDSEQRDSLQSLKFDFIPLKYQDYFKDAEYSTFVHTKNGTTLDVMKLDTKLSKSEYIDFEKFMRKNNIGYYSRVAKKFIIENKEIINFYGKEKITPLESPKDEDISDLGMKKNESVNLKNGKTSTFLGLNINNLEIFEDENSVRKVQAEKDSNIYITEKVKIIPGETFKKRKDLKEMFLEGNFDYILQDELYQFTKDKSLVENCPIYAQEILQENGYIAKEDLEKYEDQDDFLEIYYKTMNNSDKNKYQDMIDHKINARSTGIAIELGFDVFGVGKEDDLKEWLKIASFEKSQSDTNVIGMSVFGVKDEFKILDDYFMDIVKTKEFFKWFSTSVIKNHKERIANNDFSKEFLLDLWNKDISIYHNVGNNFTFDEFYNMFDLDFKSKVINEFKPDKNFQNYISKIKYSNTNELKELALELTTLGNEKLNLSLNNFNSINLIINEQINKLDAELKNNFIKSIEKLRSHGDDVSTLIEEYNKTYNENYSEKDIKIDENILQKQLKLSYERLLHKKENGILNNEDIEKHNKMFFEVLTIDDIKKVSVDNKKQIDNENFEIEDSINIGGAKTKFKIYIECIKIIEKINNNEEISLDEKKTLSRMPGAGTIAQAFIRPDGSFTKGWEKEGEELLSILSKEDYESAQKSIVDAYYTDESICKAMWNAIEQFGFKGGVVVEPSCGNGNFFGYMPTNLKSNTQLIGVELNNSSSKIAQILYPKAKIHNIGYQDFKLPVDRKANLIIGNPPYGSHSINDKTNKELNGLMIHNYFMAKSIDNLEVGGVSAMIVSNSFLDNKDSTSREYVGKFANLIGAIRLPKGAFNNAGTEIVTDIIFLQKINHTQTSNIDDWKEIGEINDTPISSYYVNNPHFLLGKWGKYGTMYRGDEPALIPFENEDINVLLKNAIDSLPKYLKNKDDKIIYFNEKLAHDDDIKNICSFPVKELISENQSNNISTNARVNSYFIHENELYKRLPNINDEVVIEKVENKINSKGIEVPLNEKEIEKIKGMVQIVEVANKLRIQQLDRKTIDSDLEPIRNDLNRLYDEFVKENGFLNKNINVKLFEDDVFAPFLLSLEKNYNKGISAESAKAAGVSYQKEYAEKSDIFYIRTQSPYNSPTKADSYEDALHISLTEKAFVDLRYMSSLIDKPIDDITKYLSSKGFIFNDPNDGWVTKEEYLSGNVKQKLKETDNPLNIAALQDVIPKDIEAIDINVACGSSWIPSKDIETFIEDITGDSGIKAFYINYNASWNVDALNVSIDKELVLGTKRLRAKNVILAALNNKQVTVYDTFTDESGNKKQVVNQEETTIANDKIEEVKELWKEWIWNTSDRRERLAKLYNDLFNIYSTREYDGSHLNLPGKIDDSIIELRPHQKNAIWRVLQNGRNLFDHTVGSGKTFTAIASVMEMKRTGKAKKSLVVVPNHLTKEWGNSWLSLYPNANILVPSEKDFSAKRRKILMSRIATGDYDAIIIAHSQLTLIENDKNFEVKFIQEQVDEIKQAINLMRREKNQSGLSAKQWENKQKALENKINDLLNADKKDDNLSFGDLGIDALIVDEAHEFKNLAFHTALDRIRGLGNPTGSQRAFDLFIKTRYMLEKTNNKNLLFLTGTPISNSIAELFTMQRYMMYEELKDKRLIHFDSWAKQFSQIKTDWELSASGKYKQVTRMSRFNNMPELIAMYKEFGDVVTTEKVKEQLKLEGKTFDIPTVKNDKPNNIIVDISEDQTHVFKTLVERSENLPKGKPKKGDDNMLVIMNDAKKTSLDSRLFNSNFEDFEGSKINTMIEDVINIYHNWSDIKGTQLIFCDLSTPKGSRASLKAEIEELVKLADEGDEKAAEKLDQYTPDELEALNSDFSVYDDIKAKLIKKGIPENEIAFIHDAKTTKQKEELFLKVNSGNIRFLLGSTSKMGAGTNVQKRLVSLCHIDVPWRPSDLEQREGRIIRQGNQIYLLFKLMKELNYDKSSFNSKEKLKNLINELKLNSNHLDSLIEKAKKEEKIFSININRYATKNTLDSGLWEKIEAKAKFIQQLKNGNLLDREMEDISGEEANAAEMKAASSGNPLILEDMQLKQAITKLEAIKKNFNRSLYDREETIINYQNILKESDVKSKIYLADLEKFTIYKDRMAKNVLDFEKLKESNQEKGISNKDLEPVTNLEFIGINDKIYNKREELGNYIKMKAIQLKDETRTDIKHYDIGTIGGFSVILEKPLLFRENDLVLTINNGPHEHQFSFDVREQSSLGLVTRLLHSFDKIGTDFSNYTDSINKIKEELPKLESLNTVFPREEELQLLKKRHKVVIDTLREEDTKTMNKNSDLNGNEKNNENKIVPIWEDKNKDENILNILLNNKINITIFNKIEFELYDNCLILTNELERKDYEHFKKAFELFGGEWNKRLKAITFSNDGMKRIKECLEYKDVNSNISENNNLSSVIIQDYN